jgi:hypothetical protein
MKEIEVFKIAHQTALPADREKWAIGVYDKRWPETHPITSRVINSGALGRKPAILHWGRGVRSGQISI